MYELILFNIMQNALKYNKNQDGDIVITMTCKKLKNQNDDNDTFMFETQVVDTGVGITSDRQKTLFTPFKELKERIGIMKAQNDTLGLGLACSNTICKKMGGDITIKHSQQGLTVVAFKFPVKLKVKK